MDGVSTLKAENLKERQAPIKEAYRNDAQAAIVRLQSKGQVQRSELACRVSTRAGEIVAGMHPAAGGDGEQACSGDMLLQALVACSGVTLAAVATAMALPVEVADVEAVGEMDFRGTLGIDRHVPVGLTGIELTFHFDTQATDEQLDKLLQLTERYCVVMQSLSKDIQINCQWKRTA